MPSSTRSLIGIDVGGTFTDFVWLVDGALEVYKEATTTPQHDGVVDGLEALGVDAEARIAHGTTAATNALLERRGARTALLTTDGFADVLAIGRQNRPHLYRLSQTRPAPLVPARWRFGVCERVGADGSVVTPLDEDQVCALADELADAAIESLAVVFLFAFQRPDHEQRTVALLRERLPDVPISISSDILPEYREYERTVTTVVNAYVRPETERYLRALDAAVGARPVRVMQSSGGTIGLSQAAEQPARLVLSGPAGGVVGAVELARRALDTEAPPIMTLDMGGTSTDVALCEGAVPRTAEHTLADLPLRLPTVDIHTVGAGGGSIARVDAGGSLRVGPESAGATPGPACYGHGGTAPTVTDAHLVLGRLHPERFLGGSATLEVGAARAALAELGDALGTAPEAAALGVLRIANASMERALRRVSVERGHDPRDYTLMPFGGAGPLHACALADALGMRRILVPPAPGVLSALGLLMADVVFDTSQAILQPADALRSDPEPLRQPATRLADAVRTALADEAADEAADEPTLRAEIDLRYAGQSYELTVPLAQPITSTAVADAVEAFHDAHAQRYGHARPDARVEVVTLRVRGTVPGATPDLPTEPPADTDATSAQIGTRPIWFSADGPTETPAYERDQLHHGHPFSGPAVIYQYDTTIVIPAGWHTRVDAWRNLLIEKSAIES